MLCLRRRCLSSSQLTLSLLVAAKEGNWHQGASQEVNSSNSYNRYRGSRAQQDPRIAMEVHLTHTAPNTRTITCLREQVVEGHNHRTLRKALQAVPIQRHINQLHRVHHRSSRYLSTERTWGTKDKSITILSWQLTFTMSSGIDLRISLSSHRRRKLKTAWRNLTHLH